MWKTEVFNTICCVKILYENNSNTKFILQNNNAFNLNGISLNELQK